MYDLDAEAAGIAPLGIIAGGYPRGAADSQHDGAGWRRGKRTGRERQGFGFGAECGADRLSEGCAGDIVGGISWFGGKCQTGFDRAQRGGPFAGSEGDLDGRRGSRRRQAQQGVAVGPGDAAAINVLGAVDSANLVRVVVGRNGIRRLIQRFARQRAVERKIERKTLDVGRLLTGQLLKLGHINGQSPGGFEA